MDELTKRRVALMQRYSAIPFEKIMFMKRLEQIKNSKNNDKATNR